MSDFCTWKQHHLKLQPSTASHCYPTQGPLWAVQHWRKHFRPYCQCLGWPAPSFSVHLTSWDRQAVPCKQHTASSVQSFMWWLKFGAAKSSLLALYERQDLSHCETSGPASIKMVSVRSSLQRKVSFLSDILFNCINNCFGFKIIM